MSGAVVTEPPQRTDTPEGGWTRGRMEKAAVPVVLLLLIFMPLLFTPGNAFVADCVLALAYTVMALGLNIIVGFAGLLDLGYVAFFAIGAYTIGWFGSGFFANVAHQKGWHILVGGQAALLPGIHMNFVLILIMVFKPQGLLGEETREAG